MPTSLTFEEQLTFVREAAAALLTEARSESLTDVVPTCPGWTVADLVAHHGGVCRWSARIVAGQRTGNLPPAELTAALAAPTGRRELLDWYADGVAELVEALKSADDGPALVFLPDAPPPRLFWARRSAHEATLHRVDMLSVTLGHLPTAAGTGVPVQLAVDGLDELLMGLVPRPTSQLRADEPIVVSVVPRRQPGGLDRADRRGGTGHLRRRCR